MKLHSFRFLYVSILAFFVSCQSHPQNSASEYIYIKPEYNQVSIAPTQDSISFLLNERTYNKIKTFNLFSNNNETYIAFYDKRSVSVNIFHLQTRKQVARVELKQLFSKNESKKISAYVHNFDSIFINTSRALVLIDSMGHKLLSIDFLKHPRFAWAEFDHTTPPYIKGHYLYASVSPYVNAKSLNAIKKWRVIYEFDLKKLTAALHYRLPESYDRQLDGQLFFNHSYCINDQGRFVFSFAVDSCIYETDLKEYHKSYLGRSHYQHDNIMMGNEGTDTTFKLQVEKFFLNDTYSSIYYDPYMKRYLRLMYVRLNQEEYKNTKKKVKKLSMIIFDHNFKIIGESDIQPGLSTSSIFFSTDGKIYARVNVKDENYLHFVRLAYSDENRNTARLSQLK